GSARRVEGARARAGGRERGPRPHRRRGVVGALVHGGPGPRARRASRGRQDRGRNRARLPIGGHVAELIVLLVIAVFVLLVLARTIRIVPQTHANIVKRFGRYSRTLNAGLAIVVPFVDRIRKIV